MSTIPYLQYAFEIGRLYGGKRHNYIVACFELKRASGCVRVRVRVYVSAWLKAYVKITC